MHKICDKAAISLVMAFYIYSFSGSVAVLLLSLTASLILQTTDCRRITLAVSGGYVALCFFAPDFCIGLPLLIYEIYGSSDRLWLLGAGAAAAVAGFSRIGVAGITFLIFAAAGAAMLRSKTDKLRQSQQRLIRLRDSSTEQSGMMARRTRLLIESQDAELYAATLKERNRIAREIHDNVGHMITSSLLQVGALTALEKDEQQKQRLRAVSETLDCAMTGIRRSVHDLHDDSIDLEKTLDEVLSSAKSRFAVQLVCDFSPLMPNSVKYAFIAIVREAVNNCVKYSSGDRIRVRVDEFPLFYRLIFLDNGRNEPCEDIAIREDGGGIGLVNMRDRTEALNGRIHISGDKNEYKIFITVPKNQEKA